MIAGNRQLLRGSGSNKKLGVPATLGQPHWGAVHRTHTSQVAAGSVLVGF